MIRKLTLYALLLVFGTTTVAHADANPCTKEPWHTNILSYTFYVGEVLGSGPNDSQEVSAYDDDWMEHYGGCDGLLINGVCTFEPRNADAANGYFPAQMTPLQNPFYLDLPVKDAKLKDRWVQIRGPGGTAYGQIEDAGPAVYDDRGYVFGHDDQRPKNKIAGGGGMDVSPALNGALGFTGRDGIVNWRFIDEACVPAGPWTQIRTGGAE